MDEQNSLGSSEERRIKFLNALSANQPAEESCEQCIGALADYVEAQLDGQDYLAQFANLAQHLDSCEICADAYARIYEVELAIRTNELPNLAQIPQPNLSFLAQSSPALSSPALSSPTAAEQDAGLSVGSLGELLLDALVTTTDTIRLQLSQPLLSLLQPQAAAPLTRANQDDRYGELLYELNADAYPDLALPIKLTAFQDKQNQALCLVEVEVAPEGKSWPELGGYTVRIKFGATEETITTDPWGVSAFVDVPVEHLSALVIEVDLT